MRHRQCTQHPETWCSRCRRGFFSSEAHFPKMKTSNRRLRLVCERSCGILTLGILGVSLHLGLPKFLLRKFARPWAEWTIVDFEKTTVFSTEFPPVFNMLGELRLFDRRALWKDAAFHSACLAEDSCLTVYESSFNKISSQATVRLDQLLNLTTHTDDRVLSCDRFHDLSSAPDQLRTTQSRSSFTA